MIIFVIFDHFIPAIIVLYSEHKSYETGIVSLPENLLTAVSNF